MLGEWKCSGNKVKHFKYYPFDHKNSLKKVYDAAETTKYIVVSLSF